MIEERFGLQSFSEKKNRLPRLLIWTEESLEVGWRSGEVPMEESVYSVPENARIRGSGVRY